VEIESGKKNIESASQVVALKSINSITRTLHFSPSVKTLLKINHKMESMNTLIRQLPAISSNNTNTTTNRRLKSELIHDASEIVMDCDSAVDLTMKAMDARYKTNFYAWIKNESFVDDVAPYCKRIVADYDEMTIARGFRWLFAEWSTNAIAGLLIKIFYENGMTHPKFSRLVDELISTRSWDQSIDLVYVSIVFLLIARATLIIGEDADVTATFMRTLTASWVPQRGAELLQAVALRSRWQSAFLQRVLLRIITLDEQSTPQMRLMLVQECVKHFESLAGSIASSETAMLMRLIYGKTSTTPQKRPLSVCVSSSVSTPLSSSPGLSDALNGSTMSSPKHAMFSPRPRSPVA
jgi:hypothetical protein